MIGRHFDNFVLVKVSVAFEDHQAAPHALDGTEDMDSLNYN